jgi:hypothetical protein
MLFTHQIMLEGAWTPCTIVEENAAAPGWVKVLVPPNRTYLQKLVNLEPWYPSLYAVSLTVLFDHVIRYSNPGADWINGAIQIERPDAKRPWCGLFVVQSEDSTSYSIYRRSDPEQGTEYTGSDYDDEEIESGIPLDQLAETVKAHLAVGV